MRNLNRLSSFGLAWLLSAIASGCLGIPDDQDGGPCNEMGQCLPGYECQAGHCVREPDVEVGARRDTEDVASGDEEQTGADRAGADDEEESQTTDDSDPGQRIEPAGPELILNGGFESVDDLTDGGRAGEEYYIDGGWQTFLASANGVCRRDATSPFAGAWSARCDTLEAHDETWRFSLLQSGISVAGGETYVLGFSVRADRSRTILVSLESYHGGVDRGLHTLVVVDADWAGVEFSFEAAASDPDAKLVFMLAGDLGKVWIDQVTLKRR